MQDSTDEYPKETVSIYMSLGNTIIVAGLSCIRLSLLALLACSWGCRSTADYEAVNLPTQLRTQSTAYTQTVDLSQLARASMNTELIYPGDVLDVTIVTGLAEERRATLPLRVNEQGEINVPLVGPVLVAGLLLPDAERQLQKVCIERQIYRNPSVSVLMNSRRTNDVRVVGAVENPGTYELPSAGSDVLSALVAAGGLADDAGMTIEVRSPGGSGGQQISQRTGGDAALASYNPVSPNTYSIDLLTATQPNNRNRKNLALQDGSVVMVKPQSPKKVHVIGLVRKPNKYEMPLDEPMRVLDALAVAGGRNLELADKIHVIRQSPGKDEPVVIEVSVKEAKNDGAVNLVLAPGDVVSVEETPTTFVVETMRNFIRFGFSSAIPGL